MSRRQSSSGRLNRRESRQSISVCASMLSHPKEVAIGSRACRSADGVFVPLIVLAELSWVSLMLLKNRNDLLFRVRALVHRVLLNGQSPASSVGELSLPPDSSEGAAQIPLSLVTVISHTNPY